jgi:hypothetical protein
MSTPTTSFGVTPFGTLPSSGNEDSSPISMVPASNPFPELLPQLAAQTGAQLPSTGPQPMMLQAPISRPQNMALYGARTSNPGLHAAVNTPGSRSDTPGYGPSPAHTPLSQQYQMHPQPSVPSNAYDSRYPGLLAPMDPSTAYRHEDQAAAGQMQGQPGSMYAHGGGSARSLGDSRTQPGAGYAG